jgi:putative ABC transport system permease protein
VKTHLRFDVLASWATLETLDWGREQLADEANFWTFATYVLLREDAGAAAVADALAVLSRRYTDPRYEMSVQPLDAIALGEPRSNEIATYSIPAAVVWFLGSLALVIMLAAGFNYVGMATARAMGRGREVGVRKTVGARRGQIVGQFLVESVLVSGAALALAYGLLAWLVPAFNGLHGMQKFEVALALEDAFSPSLIGSFALLSVGVGLLAGLYPALFLSRFHPSRVLRGVAGEGGARALVLRKGLIVVQLTLSIVFLVTVGLLYRQFHFMTESDYGFRIEGVVSVPLIGNDYDVLRGEWLRHPGVLSVGATYEPPATGAVMGMDVVAARGDTVQAVAYSVDAPYFETIGLTFVAGGPPSGERDGVVLNETALGVLGLGAPAEAIGSLLDLSQFEEPQPVVGVVRDYRYTYAMQPVGPLVLYRDPTLFRWAAVRLHPDARDAALAHMEAVWARLDPVHAFEPRPLDEHVRDNDLTRVFRDGLRIIGLLSVVALTIAGLGLLSTAASRAQSRTKEVGIRKALGASVAGLVVLLAREFLVLLAVSVALAVPLAWRLNVAWLDRFAYRTSFGAEVFVLGVGGVLLLALLAVGSQVVRTASADPVKALRYE